MCKKVLVAAVAVVVAVLVINFTGAGRYVRLWLKQGREYAKAQIPPEQKLAALEEDLKQLEAQDKRHLNLVARHRVEVKETEEQVERFRRDRVNSAEKRIRALQASLAGEKEFVTYENKTFARAVLTDELRASARQFRTDEERLKAMEEGLAAKKKGLQVNEEKWRDLQLTRDRMKTRLEQLKLALAQARQAEANEKNTLDDAGYRRFSAEFDAVEREIKIKTEEFNLRTEGSSPVRAHEEKKRQQEEDDAYLKSRFGSNTDKQ